ncbi:DUF4878 domain-containing protein [Anaerotignum propionicum]|uniref:DUF5105 domain-containing protein n=1 Tax=Anaerotignum propionicum DSM 1682 TaxID=991789 RepID=A0A0X8VBW8_ANAPI|nr:DUF4878 domain-containing protein [Anaerotignum propionicum]AMJ40074.1 hypothetical protein CPRO_04650 [Anaerotignum propionicum DSM 1682]SHE80018.1 protein of unknown function [[Clostridium] propionicum DSM 1682] [Anaerotignum propionicum DSM 1682]
MFKKSLAVIFTFVMAFSCISCGEKIDPPDKVVASYLDALKNGDLTSAKAFVNEENDEILSETEDESANTLIKSILKNLTYEVVSTDAKDTTATVKTSIKNIDMKTVMGEVFSELLSLAFSGLDAEALEAKQNEAFAKALETNKETIKETEVNIQLEKKETGWIIIPTEDLADGITGGLLSYADNLNSSFGGTPEEEKAN